MNFFRKNLKKIVFGLVIVFLVILIGITSSGREDITQTESILGTIISRVQKTVFNIGQTFSNAFSSIQNISKITEENIALKEELSRLQKENRTLEDIVNNSEFLEAEYKLRMKLEYDYVEAQVITKDSGSWFDKFVIDKGEKHGVKKNDIIVQATQIDSDLVEMGLVGRVIDVGYNWAKVITIIDESSKVSFRLIENNESGIIEGNINGTVTGYFFNNRSNANTGDKLVTSGLGDIYINNIFIGTVKEVDNKNNSMKLEIQVEPAVDFSKIYKVFVLKIDR